METPIQKLIENLTEQLDRVVKEHPIEVNEPTYWRGIKEALKTIELAESLLEKEKEVIINAYWDGGHDVPTHPSTAEQYYNQTFSTEEK
jgi:hypothetical protein